MTWLVIEDFLEYMVSEDGQIYSLKTNKILKQSKNRTGYFKLNLWNSRQITVFPHRLVGKAFIDNPNNYPQINHLDGVKTNNKVSNLEWCTHKMNLQHAAAIGLIRRGEENGQSKLLEKDIINIRNSEKTATELAKQYNVHRRTIGFVLKRETWNHI